MSKKFKSNPNRAHHTDPYAVMSAEQRFELLQTAKDGVFKIITFNKYRWGYENWVTMTSAMALGDYKAIHNIISGFRSSQSKKSALALIEEIECIKKSIKAYERGV